MSRLSTAPSTAANGTRRLSEAVTFVVGAAILGTQLTVGSVVASALRGSALAWAATIAVVLMSLSLGYWLGGHAADRHPDARSLSLLVLAGALALLISQPVIRPLLAVAGSSGPSVNPGAAAALVAGLIVLAIPMILLGAVLPFAVRLQLAGPVEAGSVVGRFYAISTVGGLVGTFLAVLALDPLLGAVRSCAILGVAVATAGLAALIVASRRAVDAPDERARATGKGRLATDSVGASAPRDAGPREGGGRGGVGGACRRAPSSTGAPRDGTFDKVVV